MVYHARMTDSDPYKAPAENEPEAPAKRPDEYLGVIALAFSLLIAVFLLPDLLDIQNQSGGLLFGIITLPVCVYVSFTAVRAGGAWNLACGLPAVALQLWIVLRAVLRAVLFVMSLTGS